MNWPSLMNDPEAARASRVVADLSERDAQGGNSRSEVVGEAEFDEDLLDLGQAVDAAVPGGDLRRCG